jgi:amino acid adenylation domain-containing protein
MGYSFSKQRELFMSFPFSPPGEFTATTARCTGLQPSPSFVPFRQEDVEQSIASRFEEQVRRHGQQLALKTRTATWTYAELNRMANRIARAILARRGEGPEPIALLLEKDASFFAAILGVLKAGKFYVPLAPADPPARNATLLEDAGVRLLITDAQNSHVQRQFPRERLKVLRVDEVDTGLREDNLALEVAPENYAYILYTSGSTGRPKGVVESHRNLLHNMLNYTNDHFLSAEDRLVCLGSCAFSNILKDIYGALLNGAALCSLDVQREGLAGVARWVSEQGITVYNSVPTVFRSFLDNLQGDEDLSRVRIIRLGGEPVTRRDIELFKNHFSARCVLVNGYGSTETGTVCTYVVDHETHTPAGVIPIGYPSKGMDVLLLDPSGAQVEGPGKVGQIAVLSNYLALGYWQQPGLTNQAFPRRASAKGARLYLTGDMGYRLPGGCLVCTGRADSQVKIRGHRIEVTEIELALQEHDQVQAAVVVAHAGPAEQASLVAYLVPARGLGDLPSARELRGWLRDRLPTYAIPPAFVPIKALPLTATGKLDRHALPAPPRDRMEDSVAPLDPRNPIEARLVALWEDLLGIRPIGVQDNFFDLGGDSLQATQLCIQLQKHFGKQFPVSVLVQEGTIERLATLVAPSAQVESNSHLVPLQPAGSKPPLFLVHEVGGDVTSYKRLARHLGTQQPVFGFRGHGLLTAEQPFKRIEDMARCYIAELLSVQPQGPYYLGGWSLGAVVAYEIAQQLLSRGQQVALLALIDQRQPHLVPRHAWQGVNVLGCLRNLPNWIRDDCVHAGAGSIFSRLRLHGGRMQRRLRRVFGSARGTPELPTVADLFDLSQFPVEQRRVLECNYRALRSYVPQSYPGRTVLFRARTQPLLPGDWHRRDMGWGKLTGALVVQDVPGHHYSILHEPNVAVLAAALRQALAAVA